MKDFSLGNIREKYLAANIIGASIPSYDKKKLNVIIAGVGTKTYNYPTEAAALAMYDSI